MVTATATKPRGTRATVINNVSNDGEFTVEAGQPYFVDLTIEGVSALLFHRWSCDDVEAKAKAAKGSAAKKSDNVESYVWRNAKGNLCIPGEYLRMAVVNAAKYRQDPRSPRKSAMDMFRAGIVCSTELADLGVKGWDFLDRRRVTVQRNGITRERPGMHEGWKTSFRLMVNTPEYIPANLLREVVVDAGRLVGLGDFRPTFGRFSIGRFAPVRG